jgi:serine/threonine protein kinase
MLRHGGRREVEHPELGESAARFQLHDELGTGATSVVYRAWDRERGGWVALKILNERQSNNATAHARFIAEGRTMLALDHRYLIGTYGAIDGRRPFLVLEVAEGGSLKQWVDKHGRMPERMAADVAIQICKGIGAAHQHGVIHRDVKPHNVLINRRGSCKVTDFGIARILREDGAEDVPDATTNDDRMGTIGYMAPEQRSDPRLVDPRTDVYGIGATLVHLVTGRPPLSQLFYADRDRDLIADVPDLFTPIVLRATAFKPDDRYASVADLARALHEVRSLLPPIPIATPNLTADLPPEPPPPVGATVTPGAAWEVPSLGSESSLDSHPMRTPNSVSGRNKPVTTPPPAALRRASQEAMATPVPESRRTAVRWGIALGVVIGWTLVALVVVTLWVNAATQGVVRAQTDFARLVAREAGVVEDLAALGADRHTLVGALEQYRAARAGPLAFDRASSLVQALDAARDAHAGPGVREERAARASGGVDDLEQALDAWREALATWQGRVTSTPGRIVRAFQSR